MLLPSGILARDFTYTYQGQTLKYTVIDEIAKTCMTREGYYNGNRYLPGNECTGNVTIPSKVTDGVNEYRVTTIGSKAFYECAGLLSVSIPNSVNLIGSNAFYGCNNLSSVNIPNSVTTIGFSAFCACRSLTSIVIPKSVTSIGSGSFSGCSGLTSVDIPNSITSIDENTFNGCSSLTSVNIPNSVTTIGKNAFSYCTNLNSVYITDLNSWCNINFGDYSSNPLHFAHRLFLNETEIKNLEIPATVSKIKNYTFCGCSDLTSVNIPNSVTSIGELAFYNCSGLTSVTIPNSVTSIEKRAFYGCRGLTSVIIPIFVNSIGSDAFDECTGLRKSAYPSNLSNPFKNGISISYPTNESIYVENGAIFSANKTKLYFVPFDVKTFEIQKDVKEINNNAFLGCDELTTISFNAENFTGRFSESKLPSNVRNLIIGNNVKIIPTGVFSGCSGLTSVTIPNSVTSIDKSAFSGCSGLTSVDIPNSVTSIGEFTFQNCKGLASITIPSSVTSIGEGTFYGCSGLKSITIPNSVTSIGKDAFYDCSGLIEVDIPNSVTSIGERAFYGCSGLKSIDIPNSVISIDSSAFNGCSGLTEVDIPNSVTSISPATFHGCRGLKSVTLPSSVTSIGASAFNGCTCLESVDLPNSITSIGSSAFSGCTGLKSVILPNSVTSIGSSAFSECRSLLVVRISNSVTSIESYTFADCSSLNEVSMPNSVTSIGSSAFSDCSSLKSVYIPNSVTSIGSNAFKGCTALSTVKLPSALTTLGSDAFSGCPLKEVKAPKSIRYSRMYPDFFSWSETASITTIEFRLKPVSYLKVIDDSGKEVPLSEAAEIDKDYKYKWDGNTVTFTGLHPTQGVSFKVFGCTVYGSTSNIDITLRQVEKYADIAVVEASFGYEELVENYYFYQSVGGKKYEQKKIAVPYGNESKITFYISGDGFQNSKNLNLSYSTPKFSEEDAVATSYTKARLTAKCNLSTGAVAAIEWRRHDAPDNVKSKTEACPVVNGVLMGELRGLKDDVYYKFRPVYDRGGVKYYGEWTGFYTGDAGVYFEPEVGTLPATVSCNSVELEGYAFAGTDDVNESGIEYRRVGAASQSAGASRAESEWIKKPATSTTFFKVSLDNLAYDSEYEYRAYAVAGTKTYYGAAAVFNTGADLSGIEDIFATGVDGREISLLRNPVDGNPRLIVSGNGELVDCYIHSTTGMLMKSCSVVADGTPQEIEVALQPGMYIVTVTDGKSRSSIRLLAK